HDAVARVRRFNRLLTQRIGLLDERYLGSALPFAQARLLYEVAVLAPLATHHLRRLLAVDAGALSRGLAALEARRLVRREVDPTNGDRSAAVPCARSRNASARSSGCGSIPTRADSVWVRDCSTHWKPRRLAPGTTRSGSTRTIVSARRSRSTSRRAIARLRATTTIPTRHASMPSVSASCTESVVRTRAPPRRVKDSCAAHVVPRPRIDQTEGTVRPRTTIIGLALF